MCYCLQFINYVSGQKPTDQKDKMKEMAAKTKVFAQQLRSMPDFIAVFKMLANLRILMCMLVAWIMGAGIGIISTFLFWHLQVKLTAKLTSIKIACCNSCYIWSLSCFNWMQHFPSKFLGLWRHSNSFWHCFRHQPSLRNGNILFSLQSYRKDRTC